MRAPLLVACLLAPGLAAAKKCTAAVNGGAEQLETLCFTVLAEHDGAALQIRVYDVAAATAVTFPVSAGVTIYQEAMEFDGYYVIGYFVGYTNAKNESLLPARTAPLTLRVPSAAFPGWLGSMVVAPSLYPTRAGLPAASYGVQLADVPADGSLRLASLRVEFNQSPQPSDFNATCAQLATRLHALNIQVDDSSPVTPTHAYYWTREYYQGPWTFECWMAVKP